MRTRVGWRRAAYGVDQQRPGRAVRVVAAAAVALLLVVLATSGAVLASIGAGGAAAGGLRAGAPVPAPLVPLIEAAGTTCPEVTAALLAAQLRQESGFRADAVSPAGAQGIAQFMPGTWSTWGRDASGDGTGSPFDPVDAIPADARLLCALVARARRAALTVAPVVAALAGYNAGWGAVLRFGGVPPFPQTLQYVRAILSAVADFAPVPVASG